MWEQLHLLRPKNELYWFEEEQSHLQKWESNPSKLFLI